MNHAAELFLALCLIALAVLGFLIRRRGAAGALMAAGAWVLAAGLGLHLLPAGLGLFGLSLGRWAGLTRLGLLLSQVLFDLILYYIWERTFRRDVRDRTAFWTAWGCLVLTLLVCALPENHWLGGTANPFWRTLRTLPPAGLAAVVTVLYALTRDKHPPLRPVWLLTGLSFFCAIPLYTAGLTQFLLPLTVFRLGTVCTQLRIED